MVYFAEHKRKSVGTQIHETLESKKKKEEKLEKLEKIDASLSEMRTEIEREKVETKHLVPEVKNWVETESVKGIKNRVKNWLSLKYPVHLIGPTGCGKTILALQV
ncbi:MAG: gas vesicle protein GvpN, partial [Nanoarchaeota archaeon]